LRERAERLDSPRNFHISGDIEIIPESQQRAAAD
jgi:hypothetical protein